MTLQTSGAISASNINNEVGYTATTNWIMDSFRQLAGKATGPISFSDFYGKTRSTGGGGGGGGGGGPVQ